jgi:uncharacterized protein
MAVGDGGLSLFFNVAQLLKEPVGSTRNVAVEGEVSVPDRGTVTRVKGSVRLTHTDQGVWLDGSLEATLETECSRCLVPFGQWVTLRMSDLYGSVVDLQTGKRVDLSEEADDHFLIDEHHILDVTEGVRQYAIAAAPLQPLCQEQCPGLCPQCGANLNEGSCGCAQPIDPRWEPLKQVFSAGIRREE